MALSFDRIPTRHGKGLDGIRRSAALARDILLKAAAMVEPGITTAEIDQFVAAEIKAQGAISAFYNYKVGSKRFPGHICIGFNDEVVHGIGSDRKIQPGDIIKIDVGIEKDGWIGDNALTVPVPPISADVQRLLSATEDSLEIALDWARDGLMLGDLCHSVENYVGRFGLTVVRDYVGHGVGRKLHEEPQVPNYGIKGAKPRLRAGMTLAIEPMINLGVEQTMTLADGWTVVTMDRKPSAHYEHMVLITDGEPEILTARPRINPPLTQPLNRGVA
ncbi:type I methionyl aminopeptidase [soil metagenome]